MKETIKYAGEELLFIDPWSILFDIGHLFVFFFYKCKSCLRLENNYLFTRGYKNNYVGNCVPTYIVCCQVCASEIGH